MLNFCGTTQNSVWSDTLGLMKVFLAAVGVCAPCLWAQFVVPQGTTATCSMELRPAQAVILGGISASGLKPADVAAQLDRQMEIFGGAVREAHGVLTQLERVRAIITGRGPNDTRTSTFELVQRVRIEFTAGAPVDSILNQFLLIGLDRFGDNIENNSGRQTSMPVRYTFRDFSGEMLAFREKCRMQAEKQFCEEYPEQCASGPPKNAAGNFVARSEERVLRPEGGSNYLEWIETGPGRIVPDRSDPQLLGNITVHMKGYYSFTPMVMAR
jgi:hypothetical protein